jgi:drug/metabolite transporter (DMT)-like permease
MTQFKDQYFSNILKALMAAILFALATPLSKQFLVQLHPTLLASIFYLSAAIFLTISAPLELLTSLKSITKYPKDLWSLLGSALFGGTIGPICILYGLTKINASSTSLLLSFESVATALIAYFVMKEHLGRKTIIAITLTLLSNVLLFFEDFTFHPYALLIIIGAAAWGVDNTLTANIAAITPKTITIIKSMVAGLINLAIFRLLSQESYNTFNYTNLIYPALIGILSYGLSIILYISSAKNIGATRSQIIFSLSPYLAIILSLLFLQERPSLLFWPSLILMLVSNIIIMTENHQHMHHHHHEEHTHEHSHEDGHHDHQHDNQQDIASGKKHTHLHIHHHFAHTHHHLPDIHHHHKH